MIEMDPHVARHWRSIKRPKGVHIVEETEQFARYVVEPLERGFGDTIGNALKKLLLSSIRGTALIAFKGDKSDQGQLNGTNQAFNEVILNLKELQLQFDQNQRIEFEQTFTQAGPVYAKDLVFPEGVVLYNEDHFLFDVAQEGLTLGFIVDTGFEYKPANQHLNVPEEFIAIDANFSPVNRVEYRVSNARVGQRTDFNKLDLRIWTQGGLHPQDAIVFASRLFREQLTTLINFEEEEEEPVVEEEIEETPFENEYLNLPVSELDLPVRAANCLRSVSISYIGELVQKTEKELNNIKNFGKKSLLDITQALAKRDLEIGMKIEWKNPDLK
jgi:DNA-directed RNA polymerase subunit alpha